MAMLELLFLVLLFLPLLAPVAAVAAIGLLVHIVVVRVRGQQQRARVVWAKLAVIGACVALATYGAGLFSGGLLYLADPEDLCMIAGPGYSYSSAPSSLLPLHNPKCIYEGQRIDLVPAFVNPVFFISVSLFITAVVGVIHSRRSRVEATRNSPAS
jgi:hypothetical protein